jgi:hypothetical protein
MITDRICGAFHVQQQNMHKQKRKHKKFIILKPLCFSQFPFYSNEMKRGTRKFWQQNVSRKQFRGVHSLSLSLSLSLSRDDFFDTNFENEAEKVEQERAATMRGKCRTSEKKETKRGNKIGIVF